MIDVTSQNGTNGAKRTWYLVPKRGDMNEATEFYVATIARAAEQLGYSLQRLDSPRALPKQGDVLTLDCRTAFQLRILRPRCRVWLWLQGIVPEECALHLGQGLVNRVRIACYTAFEKAVIPRAQGTFMVSQAMRQHYRSKYGFDGRSFVMPCVNQDLNESVFVTPSKYTNPTFVYAGSMHRWQCFELSIEVFRRVRHRHSNAQLTVLTGNEAVARAAVDRAGLSDAKVMRVPIEQLQDTLRNYKYGFVLREPHVVNQVATPTKVSSYMAAGVIPITTTAIGDYVNRLRALDHVVMNDDMSADAIAAKVLAFEERTISPQHVLTEYQRIFAEYFDHSRYVPELANFLGATGL